MDKSVLWRQVKAVLDNLSVAIKGLTAKVDKFFNLRSGPNMMLVTDNSGETKWTERTHFEGYTELYLIKDHETDTSEYYAHIGPCVLKSGQTYGVVFEGKRYECVARPIGEEAVYIGNGKIIQGDNDVGNLEGNGEPFALATELLNGDLWLLMDERIRVRKFSIFQMGFGVKQIDPKFLPDMTQPLNVVKGSNDSLRSIIAAEEDDEYQMGYYSIALGPFAKASGWESFAAGGTASGRYAFSESAGEASGDWSHAEGRVTTASGSSSHAEGRNTEATSEAAHAEGYLSKASGYYAHAEGYNAKATQEAAHAEGYYTEATGSNAHAEGARTKAKGQSSHAEGSYTIAASENQHAQGKYNVEDNANKYAHIVGNGTSDNNRSNAHTLDWDGNAWFKGKVFIGGNSMDDGATELGAGGGGADWNAKEGEPGYILNRTHYEEKTLMDILPETTFTEDMASDGMFLVTSPLGGSISDGETYTVNWNGTEYACTAKGVSGNGVDLVCLGDVGMMGVGESTGEPFLFAGAPAEMAAAGVYAQIMPLDGSTSVTIKVTGLATIVHELDKKFVLSTLLEFDKKYVQPYDPDTLENGSVLLFKEFLDDGSMNWTAVKRKDFIAQFFEDSSPNGIVVCEETTRNYKLTKEFLHMQSQGGVEVDGIILRDTANAGSWLIQVDSMGQLKTTLLHQ